MTCLTAGKAVCVPGATGGTVEAGMPVPFVLLPRWAAAPLPAAFAVPRPVIAMAAAPVPTPKALPKVRLSIM